RSVPGGDRAAWVRRIGRPLRAGAAALSRLGGATVESGQRGTAAGQLRFARTRPAMPRQGAGAPRARASRTCGGYHGIAAMAGAAALDRANLPLHAISGTSDAALPDRGHLGGDPEARADSQKLVAEWLKR